MGHCQRALIGPERLDLERVIVAGCTERREYRQQMLVRRMHERGMRRATPVIEQRGDIAFGQPRLEPIGKFGHARIGIARRRAKIGCTQVMCECVIWPDPTISTPSSASGRNARPTA